MLTDNGHECILSSRCPGLAWWHKDCGRGLLGRVSEEGALSKVTEGISRFDRPLLCACQEDVLNCGQWIHHSASLGVNSNKKGKSCE